MTGTEVERSFAMVFQELPSDEDINSMARMATALAKGRMFKDVTQMEQAFSKILIGRYLGLNPAQAMMGIQLVRGNVMFSYPTLGAFVRSRPGYNYKILEHTNEAAEIEFIHEGETLGTARFTVEDAQRAKLVRGEGGWTTYPENMCVARALSKGVRFFMPEALGGIPVYVEGEIPVDGSAEELSAGEGDGSSPDVELSGEIKDRIARAESLGHEGLSDPTWWQYRISQVGVSMDATLAEADAELDAVSRQRSGDAAEQEQKRQAEMDVDLPIDLSGLPEPVAAPDAVTSENLGDGPAAAGETPASPVASGSVAREFPDVDANAIAGRLKQVMEKEAQTPEDQELKDEEEGVYRRELRAAGWTDGQIEAYVVGQSQLEL